MRKLGIIVSVGALLFASSVWSGYVMSTMWGWFIVPLFHLPSLGVAQAVGIKLFSELFKTTKRTDDKKKTKEEKRDEWIFAIVNAALFPLFMLGFGWVVKLFL